MQMEEGVVFIDAPVEEVFDILSDPDVLPRLARHSLLKLGDLQLMPDGGLHCRWVYQWLGPPVEIVSQTTEIVPNQRIVNETTGFIETTSTWELQPALSGTRVSFTLKYGTPTTRIGKLTEAFVSSQVKFEINMLLGNLKILAAQASDSTTQKTEQVVIGGQLSPVTLRR